MPADPELAAAVLVPALRDEVEVVVGRVDEIDPARVRGIRVEDAAVLVAVEDARSLSFAHAGRQRPVVVDRLVLLLPPERDALVEVELARARPDPLEAPAHSFPVSLQLPARPAPDR